MNPKLSRRAARARQYPPAANLRFSQWHRVADLVEAAEVVGDLPQQVQELLRASEANAPGRPATLPRPAPYRGSASPYDAANAGTTDAQELLSLDVSVQHQLTGNVMVYRVIAGDLAAELTPGAVITDDGYVPTTLSEELAVSILEPASALAMIRLLVGQPARWLGETDQEVVLPRGLSWRVVSVREDPAAAFRRVVLEAAAG